MDREFYEITMKQANGSLKTALQNRVQADMGGTRQEADRVVNNILDILDAHKRYSEKECVDFRNQDVRTACCVISKN